ncbi:maltose acetyltransferase domain-containing protein [Clostridium folliculivorans]|uniref:Acetyltransferase n=1 Tax=Clostridium folliculivorans TaxID=2886038 RepID=A0A9W6D9A2_9CLOT|nr:maltose acetyltransferase domain-containing protein [Clostridium folliculivorans]GKU23686.1 galactoside O-acetyltransferase [Clostridium folliculivorans]GKU29802.1 galactoside O-acetyltransferase [Clostridium folliculivorans]
MSERENIVTGKLFTDMCEGLPEERLQAKELAYEFNHTRPSEIEKRIKLINEMFGSLGNNCWIEPPINLCYGKNVSIGNNFYANFNLSLIDDYKITIGNNVLIAPNVTIAVTGHPVHPDLRQNGEMYAFPITIEDFVWIGSGAIICPGVTIGKNSVIGAGSVVTKDIPANSIAAGNPCKVLREINDDDKIYYYKGLKVE